MKDKDEELPKLQIYRPSFFPVNFITAGAERPALSIMASDLILVNGEPCLEDSVIVGALRDWAKSYETGVWK